MNFSNVALAGFPFYWAAHEFTGPQVAVQLLPDALGIETVPWNDEGTADSAGFDHITLFLVNIWGGVPSVSLLKARYPDAKYAALIDTPLEKALNDGFTGYFEEIALADVILALTPPIGAFLGTLFNKPVYPLHIPVAPVERWRPYRDMSREDYIVGLDHSYHPTPAPTMAALAAIQRATGLAIKMGAAYYQGSVRPAFQFFSTCTRSLELEYLPHMDFEGFAEITAKARLCVDLVAHHTTGRHELFSAMIGTPCVGSIYTTDTGHPQIDPFRPDDAVYEALGLLANEGHYENVRNAGFRTTEAHHGYANVRSQMTAICEGLSC